MTGNTKHLKRATAQLNADHQPRRLAGFTEPRLSPADERAVVNTAHRRNERALRGELQKSIATMTAELEFIQANLRKVSPGDHRSHLRMTQRGINTLARLVNP